MKVIVRKFRKRKYWITSFNSFINAVFKEYSYYLKPGKYKYLYRSGFLYHSEFDLSLLPETILNRNLKASSKLATFILKTCYFFIYSTKRTYVKNHNSEYNAAFALNKAGSDSGFKLFDLGPENKKVITVMNIKNFNEKIEEINTINDNFNTPIEKIKNKTNVIIEDWVDFDNASQIKEKNGFKAFNQFFDDLINFTSNYEFEKSKKINAIEVINSLKSKTKTKQLFNSMNKNVYKKLNNFDIVLNRINFFYDIGLGNFNIKNNQYHLIDYDGFQDIPPINVFFKVLLSLSVSTKMRPILFYKSGYFDDRLKALFTAEKLDYDPHLKDIYFVLSQLTEIYILYGNTTITDDVAKNYVRFFKKYFSIKPIKEEIKNHF